MPKRVTDTLPDGKSSFSIHRERLQELSFHEKNILLRYSATPPWEDIIWVSICPATKTIYGKLYPETRAAGA